LEAPEIAAARKPGQFVMFRIDEDGERVPLTIAGADSEEGTITLVFQVVGETTGKLAALGVGDSVLDLVGPLGRATHIEDFGHVLCIGGGLGIALVAPITEALKAAGNRVTSIISARNESLLILEKEMREWSDRLEIATDDGSRGFHGYPTQMLEQMIAGGEKFDVCFAVGPVPAMAAVCKVTEPHGISTIVSLNPIMVDGTGMCGGCRVTVGGETKFVCVDGPEFDGHLVDFDELAKRLAMYKPDEAHRRKLKFVPRGKPGACAVRKAAGKRPPRQPMPAQDPKTRVRNFDEVPFGLTPELAQAEAQRCLRCKKPHCMEGCPVSVKIPAFIKLIAEGDFVGAARKIKETNSLPAVCGRVCPQEEQCEKVCVVGRKGDPVAIGNLERFAADYEREGGYVEIPEPTPPSGKRVAIVGAGPAGLAAAGDLARLGHAVTIFEALHKPGGVLAYGIPEFRLPKSIVNAEVDFLRRLGVEFKLNEVIGKVAGVDELLGEKGFDAVFLGTGAGLPRFLGVPGENLNGVMSANEYLTRANLMRAFDPESDTPIPERERVAVIGAGNVAMDAARTALRLGAKQVSIVYRRSRAEMPARQDEIHHGEEEGIDFKLLSNPVRILGNDDGWVTGLECQRMELGEPDESGRRRPVPVEGDLFVLETDLVIVAVGNGPHPLVPQTTSGLALDKRGNIMADPSTGITSRPRVFAGGDIVTGAATVISAMGAGKRAAAAIHEMLAGQG
jgi:glutamate synthase (NADPH/NADH) small chain